MKVTARDVMKLHRATGSGVNAAQQFLEGAAPLLRERLMRAIESQSDETGLLHDPIEDEVEMRPFIEKAEIETSIALREYSQSRGICHFAWQTKQRILKEKYGIEWFTPAQMNLGITFD